MIRSTRRTEFASIRVPAAATSLPPLADLVERLAARAGLTTAQGYRLRLAAEECLVNIFEHGYRGATPGDVEIKGWTDEGMAWLRLTDAAPPFDPTLARPPGDLDLPLGERRMGGLGLHLTRSIVDQMHYERRAGHNQTTLAVGRNWRNACDPISDS